MTLIQIGHEPIALGADQDYAYAESRDQGSQSLPYSDMFGLYLDLVPTG